MISCFNPQISHDYLIVPVYIKNYNRSERAEERKLAARILFFSRAGICKMFFRLIYYHGMFSN